MGSSLNLHFDEFDVPLHSACPCDNVIMSRCVSEAALSIQLASIGYRNGSKLLSDDFGSDDVALYVESGSSVRLNGFQFDSQCSNSGSNINDSRQQ